jgi:hypothetical protein
VFSWRNNVSSASIGSTLWQSSPETLGINQSTDDDFIRNGTHTINMSDMMSEESDNTVMVMVIVGCIGAAVFSGIYFVFWRRSKKNNSDRENRDGGDNNEDVTVNEFPDDTKRASSSLPASIAPSAKVTHALENRERQPGDPVYDKMIISGTASLGVLLWIGSTVVLIVSLIDQGKLDNASTGDFQNLGPDACLIESTANYTYTDVKVNALNAMCVEQWEYNVQVMMETEEGDDDVAFVSASLSSNSCPGLCDDCLRFDLLFGPNYYVGTNPTVRGQYIDDTSNNTNDTSSSVVLVECFAPALPVSDLSTFYNCGPQQVENETCFLLEDTSVRLEEEQLSVRIGLAAAYCGYAGGAVLLLLAGYLVHRNKQVREEELLKVTEHEEQPEETGDDLIPKEDKHEEEDVEADKQEDTPTDAETGKP